MWWSCRVQRTTGLDAVRDALRESRALIPVFWHQHLLFGAKALLDLRPDGLKPGFLISPSVDGTAPAMLVERVGGHVIRGSSTSTGARALRDFYETIVKQEISPAITPDGPRGPVHEFKPGPVLLAQLSGSYPEHVLLIGCQPEELADYGGSLRPSVRHALEPALALAVQRLRDWGAEPRPRERPLEGNEAVTPASLALDRYERERPSAQAACRVGDARLLAAWPPAEG
jgi:hypothetical protein